VRKDPTETEGRTPGNAAKLEPPPDPPYIFVEDTYRQAAAALAQSYQEEGFLQAEVRFEELNLNVETNEATVRFQVKEGPLTKVRKVEVVGTPREFDRPSLRSFLDLGHPLRGSGVEAARLELVRALGRAGWLYSQVKADTAIGSGGAEAEVR